MDKYKFLNLLNIKLGKKTTKNNKIREGFQYLAYSYLSKPGVLTERELASVSKMNLDDEIKSELAEVIIQCQSSGINQIIDKPKGKGLNFGAKKITNAYRWNHSGIFTFMELYKDSSDNIKDYVRIYVNHIFEFMTPEELKDITFTKEEIKAGKNLCNKFKLMVDHIDGLHPSNTLKASMSFLRERRITLSVFFSILYTGNSAYHHSPLHPQFKGISNIVLQVDTTLYDQNENLVMPELLVEGLILKHKINDDFDPIPYEQSSQCFFDNAHKFYSNTPLVITLQFKLGLDDDGTSMNDLLLKMNFLSKLGHFNLNIYIYKTLEDGHPTEFNMPPVSYFKKLKNIIGFRFETDHISPDNKLSYDKIVNHHLKLNISWLDDVELEELYLGQKIRVIDISHLKFPKLKSLGFECKDYATSYNFGYFLRRHFSIIKHLTLRDFLGPVYINLESVALESFTFIGYETISWDWLSYVSTKTKSLIILKSTFLDTEIVPDLSCQEIILSRDTEMESPAMKKSIDAFISESLELGTYKVRQIPFRLSHRYFQIENGESFKAIDLYGTLIGGPLPSHLEIGSEMKSVLEKEQKATKAVENLHNWEDESDLSDDKSDSDKSDSDESDSNESDSDESESELLNSEEDLI
ncbi:hypothetical protein DFJ63DRAFT_334596 [Scheffersomyces coipomensis]|uniref:uncharacterized protein n=1 Tax=Scheffersomyces coipomensis TaxID=1788519 RepID=UPI00315DDC65